MLNIDARHVQKRKMKNAKVQHLYKTVRTAIKNAKVQHLYENAKVLKCTRHDESHQKAQTRTARMASWMILVIGWSATDPLSRYISNSLRRAFLPQRVGL